MAKPLYVGMIGQKFMGRAHSNALGQVGRFFDLPREPVMHTVCGRDAEELEAFARRWGWKGTTTRWRDLAENPQIELVDVVTPNHLHAEQAIGLLEAGKHVACEKPLAGTLERRAHACVDAARAKAKKQKTFVWYNYRRCPAAGAWPIELVREKRIGRVYHVRATLPAELGRAGHAALLALQEGGHAGSGAHGDLNAHLIDMARFLTGGRGDRRGSRSRLAHLHQGAHDPRHDGRRARATVDDALLFLASFKGDAVASFEATRVAGPAPERQLDRDQRRRRARYASTSRT